MRTNLKAWVSGLVVLGSTAAWAGTNGFVVPSFSGLPGATYNGWENFTVAQGSPGNAPDLGSTGGSARLLQFAAGGQVLGSGNLYNGTDLSRFEIRYSGTEPVAQVALQVRALGTELKYDDVRLVAWTETLGAPRTELDRVSFGPPPPSPGSGFGVSSLWQWDISGLSANSFAISFGAAEVNLSLDSAQLDVQIVPEPGPLALLGLGGGLVMLAGRGRRL